MKRIELGCPGHLVASSHCRWRRHTQIGTYRVSTVGDLYFEHDKTRQTLGASPDSFFETMVFKTSKNCDKDNEGCGCRVVLSWSEVDGERYATAGQAQAGHERYVKKYMRLK